MNMFRTEVEMLRELDIFIYQCKALSTSELRNKLISKINEFLQENDLDKDPHNFVSMPKEE